MKLIQATRFLVLVPFALSAFACTPHRVALASEPAQSITVTGQGEVFAEPDLARVRLGVEERGASADQAMKKANLRMAEITKALKDQGVEPKDVQTTELSLYFERAPDIAHPVREVMLEKAETSEAAPSDPAQNAQKQPEGFYVVRNTVTVSVREMQQVGAVIGAAMSAGANHLHGFELTLDDPSKLRDEARKRAVKKAMEKAKLLASEAQVRLGPVLSVTEVDGGESAPMMSERAISMKSANVPIEAGELSLAQSVQVVFAIEP